MINSIINTSISSKFSTNSMISHYFKGGLPDSSLLCVWHWRDRSLLALSDGLWSLCCHLLPSALQSGDEQPALCEVGMGFMGPGFSGCSFQHPSGYELELLWEPYHLPLYLWTALSLPFVLLWYFHQCHCPDRLHTATWLWYLLPDLILLHTHCFHHPEHQLHHRQEQSLLHLLLPPHCSELLLCLSFPPLSYANLRFTSGADLFHTVWCSYSASESPHL